ncbi:hypothetical protein GCM10027395_09680 [Giesbergeria sinuosa]
MTPTPSARTCGNCASFDPHGDTDGGPICWDATSFRNIATGQWERIEAKFCCDCHQTTEEDAAQTAYIEANRPAIWASIHAAAAIQKAKERTTQ